MNHWSAKRRLPGLLDGWLSEREAARVSRHASGCRRCARRLRELRLSEALLRRLPHALVPLEWGASAAEPRGSFATPFAVAVQDRMALRAALATGLVVCLFAVAAGGPWSAPRRAAHGPQSLLAAAEREAQVAEASFERAWVVN
jgi:hypothetical protein